MKAYIIHENEEWSLPLKEQLQKLSVPFEDWHMAKVNLNTASIPPNGVFYNRMSASSHSRGHRFAPEYTCLLYTSPSPRDGLLSRMPSSA